MRKMSYSESGKLGFLKVKSLFEKQRNEKSLNIRKQYEESPRICKNCSIIIPFEQRKNQFCGSSCSASFNNKKRGSFVSCQECGSSTKNKKFCSRLCSDIRNRLKNTSNCTSRNHNSVRNFLARKYGLKCSKCNWAEINATTGKCPIELDHIDGDWKNNNLENLRLLCPNCHSLTPTYKALNKGKGRPHRK